MTPIPRMFLGELSRGNNCMEIPEIVNNDDIPEEFMSDADFSFTSELDDTDSDDSDKSDSDSDDYDSTDETQELNNWDNVFWYDQRFVALVYSIYFRLASYSSLFMVVVKFRLIKPRSSPCLTQN